MCLSLSLLFGALQRPRIGNSRVLLCLSFSTFTLLGPTSFMLHGVHIFVCIFDVHFLVCACIFCIFDLHCFTLCFCTFFCIVYLCFLHCVFAIALFLHFLFFFLHCVFALAFFLHFSFAFSLHCVIALACFLHFSFAFFCITCCIFSRLQFSRISPEGGNTNIYIYIHTYICLYSLYILCPILLITALLR